MTKCLTTVGSKEDDKEIKGKRLRKDWRRLVAGPFLMRDVAITMSFEVFSKEVDPFVNS